MKTLIVLSALATITLAAPAQQGEGFDNTENVPDWHIQVHHSLPDALKREKKSPTDLSASTALHTSLSNTELQTDIAPSTFTARSHPLKKPLIVKKKYGYRLYRDSEEEKAHADSHESCGRQVKVKLCDEDGKFREMLRSSAHDLSHIHNTEDDMKHSIKMAKEAVENLQRDLKRMEHKNTMMKMAHDSETDTDLHRDIEVAREALEHIHNNFGNLESMSLHATAMTEPETIQDVHFTIARSEEEKMAQWKEALENIQKNVDIARSIENSFKAANHQDHLLPLEQLESVSTEGDHRLHEDASSHLNEDHQMRGADSTPLAIHPVKKEEGEKVHMDQGIIEHLNEHQAREGPIAENDMKHSASEAIEMKTVDIENKHPLKSENHKYHPHHGHNESHGHKDTHEHESINQHQEHEKSAEGMLVEQLAANLPTENIEDIQEHHHLAKNSEPEMKFVDFIPKTQDSVFLKKEADEQTEKSIGLDAEASLQTSAPILDTHMAASSDSVKTLTAPMFNEHQRNTEFKELAEIPQHHLHHGNLLEDTQDFHIKDMHAKSAALTDNAQTETLVKHKETNMKKGKTAETEHMEHVLQHVGKSLEIKSNVRSEDTEKKEHIPKSGQEIHLHKLQHFTETNEHLMRAAESVEEEQLTPNINVKKEQSTPSTPNINVQTEQSTSSTPNINVQTEQSTPSTPNINVNKEQTTPNINVKKGEPFTLPGMIASDVLIPGFKPPKHLLPKEAEDNFQHQTPMHVHSHRTHENRHMALMKDAELRNDFHGMDHMRNSHIAEHHFMPSRLGPHDFDMADHVHPHVHGPSRYHHNMMPHSKMHEMNGLSGGAMPSKFHPSMREAMEGFGSEHMFRWQPSHESRNAYGAGLSGSMGSSGGGAVGVFPNANAGACGIPLLLSCSPSVVSGSLAKAHSTGPASYPAPSYRNEEDFTFHNKRDIMKTTDTRTALRTPTIMKKKTGTILENKL